MHNAYTYTCTCTYIYIYVQKRIHLHLHKHIHVHSTCTKTYTYADAFTFLRTDTFFQKRQAANIEPPVRSSDPEAGCLFQIWDNLGQSIAIDHRFLRGRRTRRKWVLSYHCFILRAELFLKSYFSNILTKLVGEMPKRRRWGSNKKALCAASANANSGQCALGAPRRKGGGIARREQDGLNTITNSAEC